MIQKIKRKFNYTLTLSFVYAVTVETGNLLGTVYKPFCNCKLMRHHTIKRLKRLQKQCYLRNDSQMSLAKGKMGQL